MTCSIIFKHSLQFDNQHNRNCFKNKKRCSLQHHPHFRPTNEANSDNVFEFFEITIFFLPKFLFAREN